MDEGDSEDLNIKTISETEGVMWDKVPELCSTLVEQYLRSDFTDSNICKLLKQCLLICITNIDTEQSSPVSSSCKRLVKNIVKKYLFETVATSPLGKCDIITGDIFYILKICFENLIGTGDIDFSTKTIDKAIISFAIQSEQQQLNPSKLHTLMSIVECFINSLMIVKQTRDINLNTQKMFYQQSYFHELLLSSLFKLDCKSLSSIVLLSVIPKCLELSQENCLLLSIWSIVSNSSNKSYAHISLTDKLYVLCGLSKHFIYCNGNGSIVLHSNMFWTLVQQAMLSDDPLLRKRGLFLLIKSIDFVSHLNFNIEQKLFFWDYCKAGEFQEMWNKILILFDILEEKQSHLVIPVLQITLKQMEVSQLGEIIHPSWLLIIYARIFSHESLQVLRTGIILFLQLNVNIYACSFLKSNIIDLLFLKLNNMTLFSIHLNEGEWSLIDISLKNWFTNISRNCTNSTDLWSIIICSLTKIRWCTAPLFHILYNMSFIPKAEIFDNTTLERLSEFLKEIIQTQNVYIRGAVQCVLLNIMTNYCNKNIDLFTVANTLTVFKQKECLHRGLTTWDVCKQWIMLFSSAIGDVHIAHTIMLDDNLPLEAKARSLVLSVDSGLVMLDSTFDQLIEDYFGILIDTRIRTYASVDDSDRCLQIILNIIEDSTTFASAKSLKNDPLINSLLPYMNEIFPYICKRISSMDKLEHFNTFGLYMDTLNALSSRELVKINEEQFYMSLQIKDIYSSQNHPIIQRFFVLRVFLWFFRHTSQEREVSKPNVDLDLKNICLFILDEGHLLKIPHKAPLDEVAPRNHKVLWGRLISSHIHTIWLLLQYAIETECINADEIISNYDILGLARASLETGGGDSLIPIFGVIKYIHPILPDETKRYKQFFDSSWKCCFELRKISLFWSTFKAWVEMSFNTFSIKKKEMLPSLLKFSEDILLEAQGIPGLANVLLSHLKKELLNPKMVKPFVGFLTSVLTFGPVLRKDQRLENETINQIRSLGTELAVNSLIPQDGSRSSGEVRVCALSIVLAVADQEEGEEVVGEVVCLLIAQDRRLTEQRQRYHGNSFHHKQKHRILQALLVLESELSQSPCIKAQAGVRQLVKWSSNALQGDSHQPSVRYQLEWLLVRSLLHSQHPLDTFWTIFRQASEERTGSVCSFISVAYHLAATLKDGEFIERCVTEILPWCMAQHFNLRLYAQVVLQKLWPLDCRVASKFEAVRSSLTKSLSQGNAVRNAEKLTKDFYFTDFHPLNHFSLETIFWDLPRLSNLSKDEWVPLAILELCRTECVPLTNPDDKLKKFTTAAWVVKATGEPEIKLEASSMQKKFVPWKSIFPELEEASGATSRTEMVVVASLIDKLPNLGGLARSCEVFTAECLVLPSLEYTQDRTFSTLSMSAEKHINIVEVKPHNLPEYMREKKAAGYTLVGAEQTAASQHLETFKFPKKCLLLLGNEKEGIPVNLLPLLDVCVEVRQLGVVRSLNVHVTGALFLWEYTRQYLEGK